MSSSPALADAPPDPVPGAGPGLLGRWGAAMARHRSVVFALWLLLVLAGGAAFPALDARLGAPDFTVPGSSSARADQLIAEHFSAFGVEQDLLVVHSPSYTADDPEFRESVTRATAAAGAIEGVTGVIGPYQGDQAAQISTDRHTAFAVVGLDGDIAERVATATRLQAAVAATAAGDFEVAVTGYGPMQADLMEVETADMQRAETIGLPIAAAVLVLALGALVAALLPITVTAAGIAVAVGVLFGLTTWLTFDSLVLSVATMIATGTAIDYAMFLVSRFQEESHARGVTSRTQRAAIESAVAATLDTTGRTVLASGIIIMISLCSLVAVGLRMLDGIAIGVIAAVSATLCAAVTLLPALLAALGPAVRRGALPERLRPAIADDQPSAWDRWARTVMNRPVAFGLAGVVLLIACAFPLTTISHGIDMGMNSLDGHPSGRATVLVQDEFGPGLLAPLTVVATGPTDTPLPAAAQSAVLSFGAELDRDERVARVLPQQADGRVLLTVVPRDSFDSASVADLTREITDRADAVPGAELSVGGTPAVFADVSDRIAARFPWVITLVLTVSLVFLIVAFRSVLLAVKAIVLNLLATGAALGVTVAVFQYGLGERLLGFTSTGFVQVYLPMLVFAVLFGLSMDYEVFLIRRIRESWDRTHDNGLAVAEGLRHTARPITAAAAIMVAVFAGFVTADVLELKQIGFALAFAIALDAVIVRLVLVPAFMRLLGDWNWWLPRLPLTRRRTE
ncbi:MAG TPA: MMPL family transporter [Nocardia sp.]|uniref:MMPL family transporter n=1 Tax=Nocardia sp. TaxID=1821 RepID=UPI002B4AE663|nr:MMPL family transporter [Nocardia sp.]HLS76471.1 MMPL family transporter [Nocardia sp.]